MGDAQSPPVRSIIALSPRRQTPMNSGIKSSPGLVPLPLLDQLARRRRRHVRQERSLPHGLFSFQHGFDRTGIVGLAALIEEAQHRQFFTDLSQRPPLAGRRACTSQTLALCHHFRPQLPVALAPFTLATFLALALAGVPKLVDETGLLVLSKGARNLAASSCGLDRRLPSDRPRMRSRDEPRERSTT